MSRLPALGPRGEGWVVIQGVLFTAIAITGIGTAGGWSGFTAAASGLAGIALVVAGAGLAAAGIAGLRRGQALTAVPRPRDEGRLVEDGVYALARHPIYGGLVVAAVGWALVRASWPTLVAAAALLVFLDLKQRREEAWLRARFPGYAAYAARTRRMIPWLY